jgi:hypothetical protein
MVVKCIQDRIEVRLKQHYSDDRFWRLMGAIGRDLPDPFDLGVTCFFGEEFAAWKHQTCKVLAKRLIRLRLRSCSRALQADKRHAFAAYLRKLQCG